MTAANAVGSTTADAPFVIDRAGDGARWTAQGALTFANVGPVLEASRALPLPATGVVDCAGITVVDSATVALLLALKRRAVAQRAPLTFVNLPEAVIALAALYGVEEMLDG